MAGSMGYVYINLLIFEAEFFVIGGGFVSHPIRFVEPLGKHSPAKYKALHSTEKARGINKEWMMPVVTMRHPYSWMKSMCKVVS